MIKYIKGQHSYHIIYDQILAHFDDDDVDDDNDSIGVKLHFQIT